MSILGVVVFFGFVSVGILFYEYPDEWRRWLLLLLAYGFVIFPKGW